MGCASSAATAEKDKSHLVQSDGVGGPEGEDLGEGSGLTDSALDLRSPRSAVGNGSTTDVFVFHNEASPVSCFDEVSILWSTDGENPGIEMEKITIDVHEDFFNGENNGDNLYMKPDQVY